MAEFNIVNAADGDTSDHWNLLRAVCSVLDKSDIKWAVEFVPDPEDLETDDTFHIYMKLSSGSIGLLYGYNDGEMAMTTVHNPLLIQEL